MPDILVFDTGNDCQRMIRKDHCILFLLKYLFNLRKVKTQANDMKLHQGKFRLNVRKRFFTKRVAVHLKRFPKEVVMVPRLPEFEKLRQCCQRYGSVFGWSWVKPRIGLDNPCRSLPIQDTLWFYDPKCEFSGKIDRSLWKTNKQTKLLC